MTKIGIIGLGTMGQTHFDAYQKIENAQVVALADADAKRASEGIKYAAPSVKRTSDFHELIAMGDLDIVDICVPTMQHIELVTAALAAQKHVLCEKPLARNVADGEKIAAVVKGSKKFFMPAMCMRFWPEWAWLKRVVDEKKFGKVLGATFRRVSSMPPGWYGNGELSGGAILDLHVHDVDFVYWLFGKPNSVFSRGYDKGKTDVVHVTTQYLYDDVPLVMTEGSWGFADGFGFSMRYTVNFENATADFDLSREPTLKLTANGKTETPEYPKGFGYEPELRYFVECVQRNERPNTVTVDEAVEALRIIDAERKSLASARIEVV